MSSRPKIAIVGCGLAGPILALKLKQANIDSIIFESRAKNTGSEGSAILLTPNALRILDSLGLYKSIQNHGYNFQDFNFVSGRTLKVLGAVRSGGKARYGYDAIRISRHILRRTILEELERQDVEVRFDAKCVGIEEHEKGDVTLKFANGDVEHATLVVGADGMHSKVRKYLAPGSDLKYSGQIGIGGVIHTDQMPPEIADVTFPCLMVGRNNSFLMIPSSFDGKSVGVAVTIEEEERSREDMNKLAKDEEYLVERFREHTGDGWPELIQTAGRKIDPKSLSIWPFYAVPTLDSWMSASGRVVLIGDGAHAIPPTAGQGGACSLEDAASLGAALTVAFSGNSDGDGLNATQLGVLKKWEAHRRDRVKRICELTKQGGDSQKGSAGLMQQVLKEWIIWAVFRWSGSDSWDWVFDYNVDDVKYT